MTNQSFLFDCQNQTYIMRIAGAGTDRLINRRQEYEVYQTIAPLHLSDDIVYIDPANGYKISRYLQKSRVCNAKDASDVSRCMQTLRTFHNQNLMVGHTFDIWRQINFYESLWNKKTSVFGDYASTKERASQLKQYIDTQKKHWTLAHIDAVPDNFLFTAENEIRLIDWEYAGMQDACVDIAMFAIYAMYGRKDVEMLIDAYYTEGCTLNVRLKIYAYIALCGLLWSNWCEYKRQLGIKFGGYAVRQNEYAKEYYEIFQTERKRI